MRISSSLLAQQPTELLRFKNAKLRAQTITTHKSASFYERICECFWTSAEKPQVNKVCMIKLSHSSGSLHLETIGSLYTSASLPRTRIR
jgi:hypothetical protein